MASRVSAIRTSYDVLFMLTCISLINQHTTTLLSKSSTSLYHAMQAPTTRRAATRQRGNDENALPSQSQGLRNKPSLSHLGPPAKAAGASAPTVPSKKPTAVKAGAKRTALGGVVGNGIKEEVEEDSKKSGRSSLPRIGVRG